MLFYEPMFCDLSKKIISYIVWHNFSYNDVDIYENQAFRDQTKN